MSEPFGSATLSATALEKVVAVVLAGGLGTRVRHLLPGLPKPMAPVAGRPFLEWVVRFLGRQGLRQIVISSGYLAHVIEKHFQSYAVPGLQVQCVREPEPLGTSGGFLHAARASGLVPSAWLVLNGDSLAFANLGKLAGALNSPSIMGAILGLSVPDATRYGTVRCDMEGNLTGFAEKQPGRGVISAGVYLLARQALDLFPQFMPQSFERDVFPAWIKQGTPIRVLPVEAPFLDIGTEESLAKAEGFIRTHLGEFGEVNPG
jgi:D-glycero-alpha-D-manno-heptose 1-phosphate guanylyltransferase